MTAGSEIVKKIGEKLDREGVTIYLSVCTQDFARPSHFIRIETCKIRPDGGGHAEVTLTVRVISHARTDNHGNGDPEDIAKLAAEVATALMEIGVDAGDIWADADEISQRFGADGVETDAKYTYYDVVRQPDDAPTMETAEVRL